MNSQETFNFFEDKQEVNFKDLMPGESVVFHTENNSYTVEAKNGEFYLTNSLLIDSEPKKIKIFGIPPRIGNDPQRMRSNLLSLGDNLEIYFDEDKSETSVGPIVSIRHFKKPLQQ